jgi:serine/threonine protein kinase
MRLVRPQAGLQEPELADETAIKRGLDALASGACDEEAFLQSMHAIFESDPEVSWEVLSQLDQYYRRGRIEAEVFQALKKSLEESAVRTANSRVAQNRPVPRESAGPREAAPREAARREALPRDPPVSRESAAPREAGPREAAPREAAPRASAVRRDPPLAREPAVPREAREPSVDPLPLDAGLELKPGAVLRRRYRLENILGRGRLGTVFEALDEYRLESAAGVHIAIKVLHAGAAKRAESLSELRQEFQQLQLLSHPNIVRVFEFDHDGPVAFFTMELLDGVPLSRVLDERAFIPLERAQALAVVRDIGAAIAYGHSRGVVHGDINPQNVFVTSPGDLRILGFTAARGLQQHSFPALDFELTLPFATSGYASCQVLKGEQPDTSDDIFALACIAYRLLSGTHPFFGRTAIEARQAGVKPRRPPHLSTRQWQALRAGLRWERQGRPTDMQQWLEQFDLRGAAKHVAPLADLLQAPERRESYSSFNAAAALAVALIIAAFFWFVSNRGQTGIDSGTPPHIPSASPATATPQRTAPAADSAHSTPPPTSRERPSSASRETSPAATSPAATSPAATSPSATSPSATSPSATSPPPTVAAAPTTTPVKPSTTAPPAAVAWGPPKLEMAADTIDVPPAEPSAEVTVRRKGSLRGETNFTWWTESGTAKPGADFSPVVPQLAYIGDGKSSITLSIPLKDARRTQPKSFYVVIDQSEGGAATGARTLTMVTLQPPD